MNTFKARYIAGFWPEFNGLVGTARPTDGFHHADSCEQGQYLIEFDPEDTRGVATTIYAEREHLEIVRETA